MVAVNVDGDPEKHYFGRYFKLSKIADALRDLLCKRAIDFLDQEAGALRAA